MSTIEITENNVLNSIVKTISDGIGKEYTYYKEQIPEGFKRPSFHIKKVNNVIGKDYSGNNAHFETNNYRYVIRYFTNEKLKIIEDINNIEDKLKGLLDYITLYNLQTEDNSFVSNPQRINEVSYEVVDNVLIVYILFTIRTVKWTEIDKVKYNTLVQNIK